MRILILGAGATGGYFGGRLAQAGVDVSFLVRPARAAQLRSNGLRIHSPRGDATIAVTALTADTLASVIDAPPFDLILLSCKAYDLGNALEAVVPAMHTDTSVLPILNGLRHYPLLDTRFGGEHVLGGLCFINAVLDHDGTVQHLAKPASLTFGERDGRGSDSARVRAFAAACTQAGLDHLATPRIAQEQWIKYTFLTTLAAATCLMRAPIGAIVASDDGVALLRGLYTECIAVAETAGEPIPDTAQARALQLLTQPGSPMKASMLRDLEAGRQVEAQHIVGDMLERARSAGHAVPLLMAAYCHLQAYQASLPER
ncbi:2-dehydropantoate 2-reductase [Xanthomonas albilineans]|uniref:2-dehydropantoate 2-reductase n=1 Tax=Xanthomonas albilineans TaxID=29447 RepID=UPI0005F32816|nr:2-dehydropantoate 2-reductase [Xanthomonas albilineans]PPU91770.1 2-dehydropantoate 2-reductase [Xanthomonas albilineans]